MANLLQSLRSGMRSWPGLSLDQFMQELMLFQGQAYPMAPMGSLGSVKDEIPATFTGLADQAYASNGLVFACMLVRMMHFSEARFQFQQMRGGRPGNLFGTAELDILEHPWPGGTTGDLLTKATLDADLAGNFYCVRDGNTLRRLRPEWVTIVMGSHAEPDYPSASWDAEVIGYLYNSHRTAPKAFDVSEVAHFAPIPDPLANFRGMSWLVPLIREIQADSAAMTHKLQFFTKGATPNAVVSFDASVKQDQFDLWVDKFEKGHTGVLNAYKTLYLGAGADLKVIGSDLKQLDFAVTQGHGETRVAAAAQVPPIIVGLSEGLASGTYSNYGQARRRFGDGTCRPWWRNFAGSLAPIIRVPGGARLWYDDRDISFLKEDLQDAALIQGTRASTIRNYVDGGFTPESAVACVMAGDESLLEHTGLYSVQLQAPGVPLGPGATLPAPAQPAAAAALAAKQQQKQLGAKTGADDMRRLLAPWAESLAKQTETGR